MPSLPLAAALLLPTSSAAFDVPGDGGGSVSVKQISVSVPGTEDEATTQRKVAALKAAAASITSCADVEPVAARIGAQVVVNDHVALAAFPAPLREVLAHQKIGTAGPMFGQKGEYVRVLVLCGRSS